MRNIFYRLFFSFIFILLMFSRTSAAAPSISSLKTQVNLKDGKPVVLVTWAMDKKDKYKFELFAVSGTTNKKICSTDLKISQGGICIDATVIKDQVITYNLVVTPASGSNITKTSEPVTIKPAATASSPKPGTTGETSEATSDATGEEVTGTTEPVATFEPIKANTGLGSFSNIGEFIKEMIKKFAVPFAIAVAIFILVYAGYSYALSGGNPEQLTQSKELIVGAILGLTTIFLIGWVLATILAPI